MTRYDRIHQCVYEYTKEWIENNEISMEGVDASYICHLTKIDRSNVSRELNQLWKDGKLIKLQGRPTFFLDYGLIKKEYPAQYIPLMIPSGSSLASYLRKQDETREEQGAAEPNRNPLNRIIGSSGGTLTQAVNDAVSAVSYKGRSLPILIEGGKGIRKRNFVTSIYDYVRINKLKSEDARLIIINCQEFVDNEERFIRRVLGSGEEKGAFELANKGIIYFQNIHALSQAALAPIIDAVTFSYYFKIGEIRRRKLDVSLIASVNDDATEEQMRFFRSGFPLIIKLPDFNRRNIYEKIEMLLHLFTEEAESLQTNIVINKSILSIFLHYHYDENDRQIQNYIRLTCANALNRQQIALLNTLHIEVDHLPLDLLSTRIDSKQDPVIIRALDLYDKNYILCEKDGNCDCFEYYKTIQETYSNRNLEDFAAQFSLNDDKATHMDEFIKDCIETIVSCDDSHYLRIRSSVSDKVRLTVLKEILSDPSYQSIADQNRSLLPMMAVLSDYMKKETLLRASANETELPSKQKDSAIRICEKLNIADETVIRFVSLYLELCLEYLGRNRVSVLIVAKGESIASQYEQLCRDYATSKKVAVASVDYRKDLQFNDVLELISIKTKSIIRQSGTVILTDTYPLANIEAAMKEKYELRCKTISNLSYESLIRAIDCAGSSYSIEEFLNRFGTQKQIEESSDGNDFIETFTQQVLAKTLTHINPKKAVDVLLISLDEILDELKIVKSREIVVKYLSHGVHMLERIIKKQPLDYYQLRKFSNQHHNLMDIIAKSLSAAENTFDLSIPSCEIAYLAEIFLEGVE